MSTNRHMFNKLWYIHSVELELYPVIKRANYTHTTWKNFLLIILNEKSQTNKYICFKFAIPWLRGKDRQ